MDPLTGFGLFAVTAMLVCYALERKSPWFILGFAAACALGSVYCFLQGAWAFGVIETILSLVALWRCKHSKGTLAERSGHAHSETTPSVRRFHPWQLFASAFAAFRSGYASTSSDS